MDLKNRNYKTALFIDGQNLLPFDFNNMKKALEGYNLLIKRVYLTKKEIEYHSKKGICLVDALENSGFEVVLTVNLDNVDSYLVVDAMDAIMKGNIEAVALGACDRDYAYFLRKMKFEGKFTILITKEGKKASPVLENIVDKHIVISNQNKLC